MASSATWTSQLSGKRAATVITPRTGKTETGCSATTSDFSVERIRRAFGTEELYGSSTQKTSWALGDQRSGALPEIEFFLLSRTRPSISSFRGRYMIMAAAEIRISRYK